jgi:transcriptional regulator NrdR family protein
MPKIVIKRDGAKESFIKEKIVVSVIKTGASLDLARDIADKIDKRTKNEIKTSEIKKSVLDKLTLHNPDLPKRWISYDKSVKRLYKYKY